MSIKLQTIIILGTILVLFYIINMARKKKMDLKYGLGWMLVDVIILLLSINPNNLSVIAGFFGIASPVNMLFFFSFCFSVVIIFFQSMAISNLTDKVKKLSQEIAIIRKDMHENYKKHL